MAKTAKKKKLHSKQKIGVLLTGELIFRCFSQKIRPEWLFNRLGIHSLKLWTSRFGSEVLEYVKESFNVPGWINGESCFSNVIYGIRDVDMDVEAPLGASTALFGNSLRLIIWK